MLLNLRQLGVRGNDDSELEMVRFSWGNISANDSEVVFNHNHPKLPNETCASIV